MFLLFISKSVKINWLDVYERSKCGGANEMAEHLARINNDDAIFLFSHTRVCFFYFFHLKNKNLRWFYFGSFLHFFRTRHEILVQFVAAFEVCVRVFLLFAVSFGLHNLECAQCTRIKWARAHMNAWCQWLLCKSWLEYVSFLVVNPPQHIHQLHISLENASCVCHCSIVCCSF